MVAKNGRDRAGRFAEGNPGGPGRPPRAVEIDYLRVLGDVCSLERWRAICERAAADAEGGDARARDWLAGYLLGEAHHVMGTMHSTTRLTEVAAIEGRPDLVAEVVEARRAEIEL